MGVLNTEDTSLQENKQYQKRKKSNAPKAVYIYVLIFALIFTFCCLRAVFQMTNSRSVTITINSASVAKGQNPDGTAFDIGTRELYKNIYENITEGKEMYVTAKMASRIVGVIEAIHAQNPLEVRYHN